MGERVVGGRFALRRKVGAGGMGVVWQAEDLALGGLVAVKVLSGDGGLDAARFTREALVLEQLDHPGIVRHVAHGSADETGGDAFLAMEWIEGEDLAARLARGALPQREALALLHALAEALAYAHAQGIVHRDLKPGNVMLPAGRPGAPKLLDFGIARVRTSKATLPGTVFGTAGYMAPEQARGEEGIDARADVFALGALAFECFVGRPAFEGDHPMVILGKVIAGTAPRLREHAEVPAWLDELVARMTSRDRAGRPADAAVVLAEIDRAAGAADAPAPSRASSTWTLSAPLRFRTCAVIGEPAGEGVRTDAPTESSEVGDRGDVRGLLARVEGGFGVRVELLGARGLLVLGAGTMAFEPQRVLAATVALVDGLTESGPRVAAVATGRGEQLDAEVLNRATRAAAGALPGTVAVDELTLSINGRLDLSPRVVRAAGAPGARPLAAGGRFVGRAQEVARLEASLDDAAAGGARAVVVRGAPGVGKSRLAGVLEERLRVRGAKILSARARPLLEPPPFALLADLARSGLGLPADADRDEALEAIEQALGEGGRDAARLLALVFGTMDTSPTSDVAVGTAEPGRRALERLAARWCERSPVALVVDDADLADGPSLEAVAGLLRALESRPVLVVAFAREGASEPTRSLRGATELLLGELGRAASEALVRDVLGARAETALVERIVARGGGNAFFLEELARSALSGDEGLAPEGLLAVVEQRLDGLGAAPRAVLDAASLVGGLLDDALLRALELVPEDQLRAGIDALVREGLLEIDWAAGGADRQPAYRFRSEVTREVAYAAVPEDRRRAGHAAAARALAKRGAPPAVLAEHLERAADRPGAIAALLGAAEQARAFGDLAGVLRASERAARLGAAGETLGRLRGLTAHARIWRAEYAEAERDATEAMRLLARGSRGWLGAAFDLAYVYAQTSRPSAILDLLEGVRPYAEVDPPGTAATLAEAANGLALEGDTARSDALFDEIEALAPLASLPPAAAARVLRARGMVALVRGNVAGFRRDRAEAARRYEEAGELQAAAEMVTSLGYADMLLGRYREAISALRASVSEAVRLGSSRLELLGKHNLGLALARVGEVREAEALERACLDGFAQAGDRRLRSTSATYLAFALMGQNRLADAEATLREALEAEPPPSCRCETLGHLANVLRAQGRVPEAAAASEEAHRLLEELGSIDEADTFIRVVHAECLLAVGREDQARAVLLEARRRIADAAARLDDAADRASFLGAVPENARALALAAKVCHLPG